MIIFIIVLVAKKTLRTISDNKRYLPEQKDKAKLIKLEKLSTMKLGKKVIIAKIIERCELGVNKNKTKLLS